MNEFVRIEGFEEWYSINRKGEIKTTNWKNQGRTAIMKPAFDAKGYLRTALKRTDGKISTVKMHRLVALTFIPNPEHKPTVNHINGIKHDNRVENLEWATHREQYYHAVSIGLIKTVPIKPNQKRSANPIKKIMIGRKIYVSQEQIDKTNATKDLNGTHPVGEKNAFSKLTEKDVLEIRAKFKPRVVTREMLAKEYNVKPSCIKDVVIRKSWKHI
jgi:hypothetical protein